MAHNHPPLVWDLETSGMYVYLLLHTYNTQEASHEAINPLGPIALISIMRLSAS